MFCICPGHVCSLLQSEATNQSTDAQPGRSSRYPQMGIGSSKPALQQLTEQTPAAGRFSFPFPSLSRNPIATTPLCCPLSAPTAKESQYRYGWQRALRSPTVHPPSPPPAHVPQCHISNTHPLGNTLRSGRRSAASEHHLHCLCCLEWGCLGKG